MVKNMKHRLDYIYASITLNGDGSKSEIILRQEVSAATSESELNAITDTRV